MASSPVQTAAPARRKRRRWPLVLLGVVLTLIAAWLLVAFVIQPEHAYVPSAGKVLNEEPAFPAPAYDVWGRSVWPEEVGRLLRSEQGRALLSPDGGAVAIDDDLLALGRRAFYEETFGNEIFLTDVLGILDGPLTATQLAKALLALNGAGTTNLRVALAEAVTVGGKTFEKGTLIDTGLDVPRGAYVPLGMRIKYARGRVYVGITCAACHSLDTPVPVPSATTTLQVPTDRLDPDQLALAMALKGTQGGYKVPGLMGLWWTAPYLHDGGVAVGADERTQLGMAGTLVQGLAADPANSLRGLVDRRLREKVVAANRASPDLREMNVRGIGHEFWVDAGAGYSRDEQQALIRYLLTVSVPEGGDR